MGVHQTLDLTSRNILEFKFLDMFFKQGFTYSHGEMLIGLKDTF